MSLITRNAKELGVTAQLMSQNLPIVSCMRGRRGFVLEVQHHAELYFLDDSREFRAARHNKCSRAG